MIFLPFNRILNFDAITVYHCEMAFSIEFNVGNMSIYAERKSEMGNWANQVKWLWRIYVKLCKQVSFSNWICCSLYCQYWIVRQSKRTRHGYDKEINFEHSMFCRSSSSDKRVTSLCETPQHQPNFKLVFQFTLSNFQSKCFDWAELLCAFLQSIVCLLLFVKLH